MVLQQMDDNQNTFMNGDPNNQQDLAEDMAEDMIEMTDEEGNTLLFKIIDYFFYNGKEYAILTDSIEADADAAGMSCYVMKIVETTDESGEVLEEFLPVEDQKLEAKLMEIATLKLNDDEQADDED